jgi:hypothetical protein
VKERLRAQGVRLTLVQPRDINVQANAHLAAHPELYEPTKERAWRLVRPRRKSGIMITPDRSVHQTDHTKSTTENIGENLHPRGDPVTTNGALQGMR